MCLISSFANLTDLDLIAETRVILTALAGNSHFPEPRPESVSSLAVLTEARAAYIAAYEAAQSRDTFKVAGKNAAKAQLAELFSQLAHYIEGRRQRHRCPRQQRFRPAPNRRPPCP